MTELQSKANSIKGWHLHIYHDAPDREKIEWIRGELSRHFRCAMSQVRDTFGGPHPKPNVGVQVRHEEFADVIGWLTMNRGDLSILAHCQTEDSFDDHVENAFWMGPPLALDAEYLERIKNGQRNPWRGIEFFNGAEPEWEPARP